MNSFSLDREVSSAMLTVVKQTVSVLLGAFVAASISTPFMAPALYGATLTAEHDIQPRQATVGDLLEYNISVTGNINHQISLPDLEDLLSEFTILSQNISNTDSGQTRHIQLSAVIASYVVGPILVPTATVTFTEAQFNSNDGTTNTANVSLKQIKTVGPIPIGIVSVLTSTKNLNQAENIIAPFSLPIDWKRYIIGLVLLFIFSVIGLYVYKKYYDVRESQEPMLGPQEPTKSPWETIMEALELIENTQIKSKEQIKPLYFLLTDAMKQYFTALFKVPFLEKTTSEVLHDLAEHVDEQTLRRVSHVFEQADLIKYTTALPTKTGHFELIKRAKDVAHRLLEKQKGDLS